MDGVALASVVSTGSVAVLTLVFNATTKRGDRKHDMNLEFQKRVWDTKSTALLSLIQRCESISAAATEPNADREDRQAALWWRFYDSGFTIHTPELVAYASDSLNHHVSDLQREMQRASKADAMVNAMTHDYAVRKARSAKEEAIDRRDYEAAVKYRDEERSHTRALGAESGINLEQVERICRDIVAGAREDLRS
jgi:hypothetical protein